MKYLKSPVVLSYFLFLFIAINSKFLFSQSGWDTQYSNGNAKPINEIFFVNENTGWAASGGGCTFVTCGNFFRTTNGGVNWNMILQASISFKSFDFEDEFSGWMVGVYANDIGGRGRYYYKTTNGGINWILKLHDTLSGSFNCVQFINSSTGWICGSLNNQGITMKSSDGGETWDNYTETMSSELICVFFVNSETGWACARPGGEVLKTTNSGINWSLQASYNNSFSSVYFINPNTGWITGDSGLIIKTSNSGINWSRLSSGVNNHLMSVYFISNDTGWASGNDGVILFTSNGGNNWLQQVSNTNYDLNSVFFINKGTGWSAGGFHMITGECTILKTTTSGIIPVKQLGEEVPKSYALYQNYPNPFNPSTKIIFEIPGTGLKDEENIKIIIYDVLGQEITILLDEYRLNPGTYEVVWDASNYPSGVYFYKLQTDEHSETRKMVLIK